MMTSLKKGFTLIELLVVITIIGILATGAVTTFTSQIQKSRDTTRISSTKALQSGIEQFYQDVSEYPAGLEGWTDGGQLSSSTTVNDYVPNLAQDPKHDQTCNGARCAYIYAVGSDSNGINNGAYELSTAFENQGNIDNKAGTDDGDDPDRLEMGILKTGTASPQADLDTLLAQGDSVGSTAAAATTPRLVILNGSVITAP